jgi:hypothetical protein
VLAQFLDEGFEVLAVSRRKPDVVMAGVCFCHPTDLWAAELAPRLARFATAP